MSELIDNLINSDMKNQNQEFDGKWYMAKPYDFIGFRGFLYRLEDAWRVLTGKSRAYHFYEDVRKK